MRWCMQMCQIHRSRRGDACLLLREESCLSCLGINAANLHEPAVKQQALVDDWFHHPVSPENSPPETQISAWILNLGGLDAQGKSFVYLFQSRRKGFTTLMRCLFSCTEEVTFVSFPHFPGSFWGCCWWHTGTLSVYRTGCDRRENDRPEDLRQNRWMVRNIPATCEFIP